MQVLNAIRDSGAEKIHVKSSSSVFQLQKPVNQESIKRSLKQNDYEKRHNVSNISYILHSLINVHVHGIWRQLLDFTEPLNINPGRNYCGN